MKGYMEKYIQEKEVSCLNYDRTINIKECVD